MKKFVLYTAIFEKMSVFRSLKLSIPNVDKFCYTDLDIKNDFYEIRGMELNRLDPTRRNRFVKICIPDEIFDNYEYSLYLDSKHPMSIDFEQLLSCMEPESDFLLSKHPRRDCIYEEGKVCIEKGKGFRAGILKQLDFYRSENYPPHNGLYAAYWLFRRHTKKLKEFSKLWWEQVDKYSYRDQISLPYVAWKYGMKISLYEGRK